MPATAVTLRQAQGKTRIKKVAPEIPQTLDQAAIFVGRVGRCQRELDRIELELKERRAKLDEEEARLLGPLEEEKSELMNALIAFAEPQKRELINEAGKKTIDLATGKIAWRLNPPAVSTRDTQGAVETLEALGLSQFVRVKKELDKDALLAARERLDPIPGIKFTRTEVFAVTPNDHEREIIETRTIRL